MMVNEWVVGSYAADQAKHILALSGQGVGYFVLEHSGNSRSPVILAAFRYVSDEPVPSHLEEVKDPAKISQLEKRRLERQGLRADETDD